MENPVNTPNLSKAVAEVINFAASCMMEAASRYLLEVRRVNPSAILAKDAELQAEFVKQLNISFEPAWIDCIKHSTDRDQQILFFRREMQDAGVRAVKKVFGFEVTA